MHMASNDYFWRRVIYVQWTRTIMEKKKIFFNWKKPRTKNQETKNIVMWCYVTMFKMCVIIRGVK